MHIKSPSCGALIVEGRRHPCLGIVVRNVRRHLPTWPIIIRCGKDDFDWTKRAIEEVSNVRVIPLDVSGLSLREYSALLTSETFWNAIPWDKVLIFQTDSLILKGDQRTIHRFVKYDYVGAPWRHLFVGPRSKGRNMVGNGGFSLRSKWAAVEAIRRAPKRMARHPEDLFFARFFLQNTRRYQLPPPEIARLFSMEHIFEPHTFGMHKCWKYISQAQWKQLTKSNRELRALRILFTRGRRDGVASPARIEILRMLLNSVTTQKRTQTQRATTKTSRGPKNPPKPPPKNRPSPMRSGAAALLPKRRARDLARLERSRAIAKAAGSNARNRKTLRRSMAVVG